MRIRHLAIMVAAAVSLLALTPIVAPAGAAPFPAPVAVASDADQAHLDAMSPSFPGMNPARTHVFAQRGYATSGGNGPLTYHGGALLPHVNLVAIFWGNFSTAANTEYVNRIKAFLGSMVCGSPAPACANPSNAHLNSQYWSAYTHDTGTVTTIAFDSSTVMFDSGSNPPKSSPSTSTIVNEVSKVLTANHRTPNANTLYLVFTSNYPNSARYCAWHSAGTISGTAVAVGYEPNLAGVSGCSVSYYGLYKSTYPGASGAKLAADSTSSVATHEIFEAMTDPMTSGSGWYDAAGYENGDKCSWYYGADLEHGYVIQPEYNNGFTAFGLDPYAGVTANPCPNFTTP